MIRASIAFCCFASLTACTMTPHTVQPTIALQPTTSAAVQGRPISLMVVDERSEPEIGNRGYMRGASITLGGDLVAITIASLSTALKQMGFQVVTSAPVTMRVDLRDLSFKESQGFWVNGRQANAAIKVTVEGNKTAFERMYRSDLRRKGGIAASSGSAINENVNEALSDVLNKAIHDPELISALSAP